MGNLFLGLDCSTQSFTGIVIDLSSKNIVYHNSINYSKDIPLYNDQNAIIVDESEQKIHQYPLMWIEALEQLFEDLVQSSIIVKDIKFISGSGQQHGTVYLNNTFAEKLQNLNPTISLRDQLKDSFSRKTSPIWMDSSTTKQCEEIREKLGGKQNVIKLTGSDTFERFSGPQIKKFYQENPKDYQNTEKIHLVSSFLASILVGQHAPIDYGDGAGMNLMNIKHRVWDQRALEVTAPNLKEKLPKLKNSNKIIGPISDYFVKKYGFSPDTKVVTWSGDNPNSLIGIGLVSKGRFAISLGTSDTFFGYLKNLHLDMKGEGHVFGAPTGDYMSLICYKNGSLARERIKERFDLTWKEFSNLLEKTPPGNFGKIMLPYFYPEIVPLVLQPKVYRFGFDENDMEGNVRAIIEAQFLSMRLHSRWIKEKPREIFATGGASANKEILQIAADIFKTPIRRFQFTDSAALGAAFRATYSYYIQKEIDVSWLELLEGFLNSQLIETIEPVFRNTKLYDDMARLYEKYENFIVNHADNPEKERQKFIEKYFES